VHCAVSDIDGHESRADLSVTAGNRWCVMGRRVFEASKASWPPPIEPDRPWIVHGSIVSRCAGEFRSTGRARAWRERHSLTRPRRRALHGARRAGSPRHDPTTGRRRDRPPRHSTHHVHSTPRWCGCQSGRFTTRPSGCCSSTAERVEQCSRRPSPSLTPSRSNGESPKSRRRWLNGLIGGVRHEQHQRQDCRSGQDARDDG